MPRKPTDDPAAAATADTGRVIPIRPELVDPPVITKRRKTSHRAVAKAPHPPVAPRSRRASPPKHRFRPASEQTRITMNRQRAIELRRDGKSYRAIAEALGVNIRTAYDYVQAELIALREVTIRDTHSLRALELERCDDLYSKLRRRIDKGDPFAIGVALKILERRSKLLGIDVPDRLDVIGALTAVSPDQIAKMSEAEIGDRLRELILRLGGAGSRSVIDVPVRALPPGESA